MDREELRIEATEFDTVWERVRAESKNPCELMSSPVAAEKPPESTVRMTENVPMTAQVYGSQGDAALQRKLMDVTADILCCCKNLASRCNGRISRTPLCIAQDERRHMKKLRAHYFILTGCAYTPEEKCVPACTVSEALRRLYTSVSDAESEFLAAAESARPDMRNTYLCFAGDEQRHAEAVECLVESMLC